MQKDQSALVACILSGLAIFAALILATMSHFDNEERKQERDRAKDTRKDRKTKLDNVERNIQEVSALLGWRPPDGKTNLDVMVSAANSWRDRLAAGGRGEYGKWEVVDDPLSVTVKEGDPLTAARDLVEKTTAWIEELQSKTKDTSDKAKDSWDKQRKIFGKLPPESKQVPELQKIQDDKRREIEDQRNQSADLERSLVETIRASEAESGGLELRIRVVQDKVDRIKSEHSVAVAAKTKEIAEIEERIRSILIRQVAEKESAEVDGRVIEVDLDGGFIYLDLGLKDALLKGTRFEVFSILKGGLKIPKGVVEVTQVEERLSKASILRSGTLRLQEGREMSGTLLQRSHDVQIAPLGGVPMTIPHDKVVWVRFDQGGEPIRTGDFANNEVFDRAKAKVFVLVGRLTGRYTNEEARNRIREFGARVEDDVRPETTYVVVGKGFREQELFQKARQLGVKMIREADLYELLGVEY